MRGYNAYFRVECCLRGFGASRIERDLCHPKRVFEGAQFDNLVTGCLFIKYIKGFRRAQKV